MPLRWSVGVKVLTEIGIAWTSGPVVDGEFGSRWSPERVAVPEKPTWSQGLTETRPRLPSSPLGVGVVLKGGGDTPWDSGLGWLVVRMAWGVP
jgi:hypothetical protein